MQTRISCPKCKASLRVTEDFSGKNVRCKACRAIFQVPEIVPVVEEVKEDGITAVPAADSRPAAAPTEMPPEDIPLASDLGPIRRRAAWPLVVAGVFGLILVGALGFASIWLFLPRGAIIADEAQPAASVQGMPAANEAAAGNLPAAPVALDIKPAPLSADRVTVQLPGSVEEICVGGGGRFLIMHLPQQRQLAVFDSNEAKVVKYLSVAEDNPRLAAGLDKLFVALPNNNVVQRWSLTNFEKEVTVPAPVRIKALAMGSASRGPLVALTEAGQNMPGAGVVCLDPQTLHESDVQLAGGNQILFFGNPGNTRSGSPINLSADGRVITGLGTYVRSGNAYKPAAGAEMPGFGNGPPGNALPAPDGRYLYTTGQHFTVRGRPIGQNNSGHGHMHWFLPALHGPYYLSLNQLNERGPGLGITIHLEGDTRQLVAVPGTDEMTRELNSLMDWQTGQTQPFEKHILLSPQARLLTVLPASKDRLSLYRVDIDQLLEASGVDYLFVASQPPAEFRPGTTFTYTIAVRSRKGDVKYKLEAGPPGMIVSAQGHLSWPVPADFADPEVSVTLTISDSSGQEVLHSFQLMSPDRQVAANQPAPGVQQFNAQLQPRVLEGDNNMPPPIVRQPPVIQAQPPRSRVRPEPAPREEQPRDIARGAPLVRPPARTVPIAVAPLAQAKVALSLPGSVRDVCVGGGGRYLILYLPQQRQLGIFDANEAKVVKYLSVAEDNVLFAAGMTKLLVVLPDRNLVQRWDLTTFQRELTVPLPVSGKVCTAVMGSAGDGTLILGGPSLRSFGALPLAFVDVGTLTEVRPGDQQGRAGMVGTHPQYPHTMRVSADGRTVTMWNIGLSPMGLQSVVLNGNSLHIYSEHTTVGEILPSPDGRTLFTGAGMYTNELKRLGDEQRNRSGPVRLPAVQGDYYLSIDTPDAIRNPGAKPRGVAVHLGRDVRPLVTLSDIDGLDLAQNPIPRFDNALTIDKRIFLIPAAKLIVTVPNSADKLCLQRFDLDEALEKSGVDYLYVSSQPVSSAVKGKPYSYLVVVKSKKGGVTFKLESAPQGMKISKDGLITWNVPADFAEPEATILLTVADSTGQEIFHTFPIVIKNKGEAAAPAPPAQSERKTPDPAATGRKELPRQTKAAKPDNSAGPSQQKPAAAPGAGSIRPAPLKEDREERALPATVDAVCVGGGGRFIFLHLPQQRKLAIFDANEAKFVKYLSLAGDNVKFAACTDKLVVLLPGTNVLQRYDLSTFEREVTVPVPVSGQVEQMLMGSATRGPLVLLVSGQGFGQGGGNPVLDPYTFKTIPELSPLRSGFVLGQGVWRISADGRVITSYSPDISPQGHTVRVRVGNEYKEHGLSGDVAGHMAPGPEGRFIYTARGVYTSEGQPSGKLGSYSDGSRYCLPAAEGESFYLCINVPGFPHGDSNGPGGKLYLHLTGDDRPLVKLDSVGVPRGLNTWGREKFGIDQRFFLIPSAKLLAVLPDTQDRLQLYRVDVDELLARSDYDYLVVLSRPPTSVVQGQSLTYTPKVKSRKGGVKVKLESGPQGMTISDQGQLTWQVPADFPPGENNIILSIGDASGQEIFQTFQLTVRGK